MSERMDTHFSLFNCHVNDAKRRALAVLGEYYPKAAEIIREAERAGDGIMFLTTTRPSQVVDMMGDEFWLATPAERHLGQSAPSTTERILRYESARLMFFVLVALFVNGEEEKS